MLAVALGFFADFSFPGVPFGTGVVVAPCVAAGVVQDCHGQHIALAGSVSSINAEAAKGTVNFAFIEPSPSPCFLRHAQVAFLGLAHLLRSGAEAALITRTEIRHCEAAENRL